MDPYFKNGWLDHVIKAEHLFLHNIYDDNQMKKMEIDNIEDYKAIILRLLNLVEEFEKYLQNEKVIDNITNFLRDRLLEDTYESISMIREDIEKIKIPKKPFDKKTRFLKTK